jgi:phage gpG-like protein
MLRLQLQLDPALSLLATLSRRLSAPGELLAPVAPIVARAIERNFDEEGRPVRWPPLAPSTLRQKPAGLKILQLTGRLRGSVRTRVEGNSIVASTDVPYAAAHQFGFPQRRLPARPFLVLTQGDLGAVAQCIAASLETTGHRAPNTEHLP